MMRKRRLPKGRFNFPDLRYCYDITGRLNMIKYIQAFDRANRLVPGGTFIKGRYV